MDTTKLLGWIATAFTIVGVALIPHNATASMAILLTGNVLWMGYGYRLDDLPLIVVNAAMLGITAWNLT